MHKGVHSITETLREAGVKTAEAFKRQDKEFDRWSRALLTPQCTYTDEPIPTEIVGLLNEAILKAGQAESLARLLDCAVDDDKLREHAANVLPLVARSLAGLQAIIGLCLGRACELKHPANAVPAGKKSANGKAARAARRR